MRSLKDAWKNHRGSGLKFRINELLWDIKYAFQRAWRGYDDTDVFNMDTNLRKRFVTLLKELDKIRHTSFSESNFSKPITIETTNKDEYTSSIINKMIGLANYSCWDDFVEEEGGEDYSELNDKAQKTLSELLDMLKIYFWQLWD